MYHPESVECEICGTQKSRNTKTNGWWNVLRTETSLKLSHFTFKQAKKQDSVCGEGCLHTYISQALGGVVARKNGMDAA